MRRITLWIMSTLAALVLLFSYRTSTMGSGGPAAVAAGGSGDSGADAARGTGGDTAGGSGGDTAPGGGGDSGTAGGATGNGSGSSGGKTYPGSVAATRWGDVQVIITVADGKITDVSVPVYPDSNGRDRQINARALPILVQETIAAQSADIDTVSGATVTSEGYKESLQAALDAAHLS